MKINEPPLFKKSMSSPGCMEYLKTNYGHILSRIDANEESDKKPNAEGSVRTYNDLSIREQIVVHIVNTYALLMGVSVVQTIARPPQYPTQRIQIHPILVYSCSKQYKNT